MTELEEKFFETFGIGKREFCDCNSDGFCPPYHSEVCDNSCVHWIKQIRYPLITDHILLELICILNKTHYKLITSQTIDGLKREVLFDCLAYSDAIKSDVRKLFEE